MNTSMTMCYRLHILRNLLHIYYAIDCLYIMQSIAHILCNRFLDYRQFANKCFSAQFYSKSSSNNSWISWPLITTKTHLMLINMHYTPHPPMLRPSTSVLRRLHVLYLIWLPYRSRWSANPNIILCFFFILINNYVK